MSFRIRLEKENFKFSCSHFTIFGADSAEPLHGHNYYISAEFTLSDLDPQLGMAFDFNVLKPIIKKLAEEYDEHILVAEHSPFQKIEQTSNSVKLQHGKKRYEFPKSDVLMINAVNITSEELARDFAQKLKSELGQKNAQKNAQKNGQKNGQKNSQNSLFKRITSMSIGIQETRGQTVFFDTDV